MSPAFTGYNMFKDKQQIAAKAKALRLTPIIEELTELNLRSSEKKVQDDFELQLKSLKLISDPLEAVAEM